MQLSSTAIYNIAGKQICNGLVFKTSEDSFTSIAILQHAHRATNINAKVGESPVGLSLKGLSLRSETEAESFFEGQARGRTP